MCGVLSNDYSLVFEIEEDCNDNCVECYLPVHQLVCNCFLGLAVIQFAKATGDLQSLSEVDLKLIALAYTLESEIHGIQHSREH